jgi:hypothetical protein
MNWTGLRSWSQIDFENFCKWVCLYYFTLLSLFYLRPETKKYKRTVFMRVLGWSQMLVSGVVSDGSAILSEPTRFSRVRASPTDASKRCARQWPSFHHCRCAAITTHHQRSTKERTMSTKTKTPKTVMQVPSYVEPVIQLHAKRQHTPCISIVNVYHDDWCDLLKGKGVCNCNPDVGEPQKFPAKKRRSAAR